MRTLRNYVLLEFIGPFLLSLGILTFVMLLGNLVQLANLIITKGIELTSVLKLFFYLIPYMLTYTVPLAALFGILLAIGRLSSDNEIIAMRSSGINIINMLMPFLYVGLILSLFLVLLNDRVIPKTRYASKKALVSMGMKNPAAFLEAGTFINSFANYVLFIYNIDGNKLGNIRVYEPQEGKPTRTIVAKRGEFIVLQDKKLVKLKLMDGTLDEPDAKNPGNFYKLNFQTYFMTLDLAPELKGGSIERKPRDMKIKDLLPEIENLNKKNIDPSPVITEIHKRLAMSFSCLIFIMLGFPLAFLTHRRQVSINFGMAILVVLTYYLLSLGAEALSLQGALPPVISMWLPDAILGIVGIILLQRLCVS